MFFGLDTSAFMPHGHCILWAPQLLFPIVISDVFIFLAYTSIPIAIYIFQRKRTDLGRNNRVILILFVLFIQLCGITHIISAYNYWHSEYVVEAVFKILTAIVSVATAGVLFRLIPQLLKLPSPSEHLVLIDELKSLNRDLEDKVSERTRVIEEQKNLMQTMLEGNPGAILKYYPVKNDQGEIIDFNTTIEFGEAHTEAGLNDPSEITGDSLLTLFPETVEMGHFKNAVDAFLNNSLEVADPLFNPVLKKYFRVVYFKKISLDFMLVYFTDVTSRENLKIEALNNAKLISLGELAGGIAHEINSPLQLISGKSRILDREIEKKSEKAAKAIETIDETVTKISSIINNLKRLSRGESESLGVVDCKKVVENTISLFDQRFKLREITIETEFISNLKEESFEIEASEVSVFQIVSNLISNAIDALDSINEKRTIRIGLTEGEGQFHLSVSNNGPEIPPEIADRVFDPLFTTKEVGKGTGLGLSLCKALAEDMGFKLKLEQNASWVRFVLSRE